jgi:hypothetical protein
VWFVDDFNNVDIAAIADNPRKMKQKEQHFVTGAHIAYSSTR